MRNCRWWGWNINKLIRNLSLHLSSSITCHLGYTHHRNNKSRGVQAKGTEDREAKCGLMWIYWKISAHWLPLFLSLHRPWIADIIPLPNFPTINIIFPQIPVVSGHRDWNISRRGAAAMLIPTNRSAFCPGSHRDDQIERYVAATEEPPMIGEIQ